MCKEVEKILAETNLTTCTVEMDGVKHTSDDFVCILSRENGDASIFYNTDALTLGMSMKMVAKAFVEAMHQLPEEERNEVSAILGGAYVLDKAEVEDHE